ncbi:MAG: MliC family protein [Acidobacteriaceae bacterium]
MWMRIWTGAAVLLIAVGANATDLTIHLKGSLKVSRVTMQFACDAQGVKMGLPAGTFSVEYINEAGSHGGAGNHLAVLPIHGDSLIFANVMSGSGARYAAGEYIWWDAAGRSVSLSSNSLAGKMRSECHRVGTT